ncbi:dihydroneopterin aldolase [Gammaproteobacteria bacterium]|nr:dihydroneopterin aldolase [Gammaproteobacteria bacterium]
MNKINSNLMLNELELEINLGWPDLERSQKQKVLVDISIIFDTPPNACISDKLDETIDYDTLIIKIIKRVNNRSYCLIEHLNHTIYCIIKDILPRNTKVTVCISKIPPIKLLKGGVQFWYGDSPEKEYK